MSNTFKYIHINNPAHLGDCIFNLISFYHIREYIEENNIYINFFCREDFHSQLKEFICSKNIQILPLLQTQNIGLCAWIGNDTILSKKEQFLIYKKNFSLYMTVFHNNLFKLLNIPVTLKDIYYGDNELITRYKRIIDAFPLFKNIKILIINSQPLSGQYSYDIDIFNNHVKMIASHYKIACTKPIDDILSTVTYGLSVKDIAAISINVDVVIAINTGPFVGLLNVFTLNRVKQFYIFDNNHKYDIPKFQMKNNITDISLEELKKYVV